MKNLKKVLSLVLALAMALSLMTVAFAKEASDFTDYSKVTNKEAVDVMVALGVFDGMNGTEFAPTGTLTREQAAKIITYMVLGKDAADKLTATKAPFADVAASRWSAGAIAYCASEGIVSGVGNNKFNPTGELTGQEFAKMLLVALGYDAQTENMVGASWAINVSKLAVTAGLDTNLGSLSAKMTREQAAQMAFNTLTATMVQYTGGTNITTSDGTSIVTGAVRSDVVGSTADGANYDSAKGDGKMQFCEQYMSNLKKTTAASGDGFKASAYIWKNGVTTVGTYAQKAFVTYTTNMNTTDGKTQIANDLAGYTKSASVAVATNAADSTIDISSNINKLAEQTGNGKVVSVYVANNAVSKVVVQSYDLYKVTLNSTNTNTVTLSKVSSGTAGNASVSVVKDGTNKDYYTAMSALAKDAYVVLAADSTGKILATADYKTVSGTYTKLSDGKYTIGGTEYQAAANGKVSNLTMSATTVYDVYLDGNGYILYAEAQSAAATNNAYILATSKDGSALSGYTYSAQLLKEDGTVQWVKVNKYNNIVPGSTQDTSNTIANEFAKPNSSYKDKFTTYSTNSDGSYNLSTVISTNDTINTITSGNPNVASNLTANSKTVFLVKQSDGSYKAYTGIKNVPNITSATTKALVDTGIVKMVVVTAGSVTGTDSKYVYFYDKTPVSTALVGDTTVYTYNAIVNGAKTTVTTVLAPTTFDNAKPGLYMNCTTDTEGRISALPADELAVSTTTSKLGAKGNIAVDYNATNIELTLKDGVLTLKAGNGEIYKADSATAASAVSGTTLSIAVANGFTAYTIKENDATNAANVLTIGEDKALAGNIAKDIIVTVNSDGEATALYVLDKLAS